MCRNIHKSVIQLLFVHLWLQTSAQQQLSFMSWRAHLLGWSSVQQVWFQYSFLQRINNSPVFFVFFKTDYKPIRLLPLLSVSKGWKVPNRNNSVTLTENAEAGLRVFSPGVSSKAADGSQLCCSRAEVGGEELELSQKAGLVHEEVKKRRECFLAGIFNVSLIS